MGRGPGRGLVFGVLTAVLFGSTLIGVLAVILLTGLVGGDPAPSATAAARIPGPMLALYESAATACPGLPWTVLAAIGTVESDNGISDLPGVHSGANFAGAEGPMQFEPATFAAYDLPVPPGGAAPPSPYDPTDAVYAAARMLCANGGADPATLHAAIFAYNHSDAYVRQVLALAQSYAQTGVLVATPGAAGSVALTWALDQLGTPYVWGGETPGVGFDCSGLIQAAYQVAGVSLPRVAQDQFGVGPALAPGNPLAPGDLVFFGQSPSDVTHVGIVVQPGEMIDAPHTGATVRLEPFPTTLGAAWGDDVYLGATRPGG